MIKYIAMRSKNMLTYRKLKVLMQSCDDSGVWDLTLCDQVLVVGL
jgi:hypothetical protein